MRGVILLVLFYNALSQPLSDEPLTRQTRELIECCPCPVSSNEGLSKLGRSHFRASDDCPCRNRNTDSEGASSMLLPRTVPGKDFAASPTRSDSPADDVKNLLEPEVDLAKSMLETLRKATEEEYQEALARDAARSVDVVPEESRNVVIIVNPRSSHVDDDFVSEASNAKESRYAHPWGTPPGTMRRSKPIKTLPDFFRIPRVRESSLILKNPWDMDSNVGASNVQESIVNMGGAAESRKPLFRLRTPLKENSKAVINNDLKASSVFNQLEEKIKNKHTILERFNLLPKIKLDNPLRKSNEDIDKNEPSPAPSNVREFMEKESARGLFTSSKRPLVLKNLLNLRDVELIPKNTPIRPIYKLKQNLNNQSPMSMDSNDKCDGSSYDSAMNEKVVLSDISSPATDTGDKNVLSDNSIAQQIPNDKFEIVEEKDTITSPSEVVPSNVYKSGPVDTDSTNDCSALLADATITSTPENVPKLEEELNNQKEGGESDEILDPSQPSEIEEVTENKYSPSVDTFDCKNDNLDLKNKVPEIDGSIVRRNEISFDYTTVNSEENRDAEDKISESTVNSRELSSTGVRPFQPLSETLTNIKDNTRKIVESMKKTTKDLVPTMPYFKKRSDSKTDIPVMKNTGDDNVNNNDSNDRESEFKADDKVTLKELQKLSDDLLVLSSNTEQNVVSKDVNGGKDSNESNLEETKNITVQNDETGAGYIKTDLDYVAAPKDVSTELNPKSCRADLDKTEPKLNDIQQFKSSSQDSEVKDMSTEASSPIAKAISPLIDPLNLNQHLGPSLLQEIDPLNLKEKLRSSLLPDLDPLNLNLDPLNVKSLQDLIVQPAIPSLSEDPLNILVKPITEVLKLPTLEDLRQRLSSVFEENDRSAENNFSDEDGDNTNDTPVEMVPAASSTSLRKVPSKKPLEDLSVDIFQLKPISSTRTDLLSNTPRLHLNNFRARLPSPHNLELKPVSLESRVGNKKGNVLGVSLNFDNDRAASRKVKPNTKLQSNPLSDLPSLDELRNNFHSRTYDLLGNSLQPNLDIFRDSNLRSLTDFDDIRRNAEKTMKGLHQKLKSTLKNGIHQNENFASPQDLFEDLNDKLKAIHYDLNDRLSSIHEDFLDQSRLKPLAFPTLPSLSTSSNNLGTVSNTFRTQKGKPVKLMKSASTKSSSDIAPLGNRGRNFNTESQISPKIKQANSRIFLGAESSPVATKVQLPKSSPTTEIPSRLLSHKTLPFKQPAFAKDIKRPMLTKPSPFKNKNSKVTITFATTTPSSLISSIDNSRSTPSMLPEKKDTSAVANPKLPAVPKQAASGFTTLRASTPASPKNNFKTANTDRSFPLQSLGPASITKLRTSDLKAKESRLRFNDNDAKRLNPIRAFNNNQANVKSDVTEKPKLVPLSWPRSGEDSFLAKVREAMQARLNSFDPAKATKRRIELDEVKSAPPNTDIKSTSPSADMLRSASENNDVITTEPLKENVSYKCKLMCTRE